MLYRKSYGFNFNEKKNNTFIAFFSSLLLSLTIKFISSLFFHFVLKKKAGLFNINCVFSTYNYFNLYKCLSYTNTSKLKLTFF